MANTFIIIAAYNESKNIGKVLAELKKEHKKIIVVDDGSKDNTFSIAKKSGATVLKHVVNLGKGAAMKTGCDYAIKLGADILVLMDADGQHEPKDVQKFIKAIKGKDIVFGYRQFSKKMPFILRFGNSFINSTTTLLFGLKIRDTQSGFRAITSNVYEKIRWTSTDYAMESEMIANAGKKRLKYKEIPIETIYSDRYKGTTVLDGIKIVINMISWKLKL
jgi:glycosyltransferase involved in cell wall biosynthesis